MIYCRKIFVVLLSLGVLAGTACAQSGAGVRTADHPGKVAEEDAKQVGYGLKMTQNEGYCDESRDVCISRHRRHNKMSHHERQMLRRQVDDAGRTLYPRQHH